MGNSKLSLSDPIQIKLLRYNKNITTKINRLIELFFELPLLEQKTILFIVSLFRSDTKSTLFQFHEYELLEYLGINTKNYGIDGEIGSIINSLHERSIDIGNDDYFLSMNWLNSVEYFDAGIIEVGISQKLSPYFLLLKEEVY